LEVFLSRVRDKLHKSTNVEISEAENKPFTASIGKFGRQEKASE